MRRLSIAVALTAVVGLALSSIGHADALQSGDGRLGTFFVGGYAKARECGLTPRIDGVRYEAREVRGTVACRKVRRVVTRFLRSGTVAAPWTCFRNHGSSPYAASCARGRRVLVRVYAPT